MSAWAPFVEGPHEGGSRGLPLRRMPNERADAQRLATISDAHVHALRDALAQHGYDGDMLGACEGWAPNQLDAVRVPLVLHELHRRDDAAAVWARLFAYDDAVPRALIESLIGADTLAALCDGDVLYARDDGLASRVRLVPFDSLWIASDDLARVEDPVMGPGVTTSGLARVLDTDGVASLLDVGCGAGTLALVARARGVADVVGVDIDARALDYARFNARLNRLECTWLQGDLGAPVEGRRFDALVSQPAYVPRPPTMDNVTFLHGGARGDELALRLLGELPALLSDRGRAWVLFDTPSARPPELAKRVRGSLGGANVDAIVVAPPSTSTKTHAIAYASLVDPELGPRFRAAVAHYAEHFRTQDIAALAHVLVHVEHCDHGRSATLVLEPANPHAVDAELLARVRAGIRLARLDDAALLRRAIVPAPEAWLVYEESLAGEPRTRWRARFDGGHGIDRGLSDTAGVLLQSLRDHQPLTAAIAAHAAAVDASPDEVTASVLELVRGLLASGLLVSP